MKTRTTNSLKAETVKNKLLLRQAITRKNQTYTSWEPNKNNYKWSEWSHGRNFVEKCEGIAWCETNIVVGSMQK